MENIVKYSNIFDNIFKYFGKWRILRSINKTHEKYVLKCIDILIFLQDCPKHIIQTVSRKCFNVEMIYLFKSRYADYDVVQHIYQNCASLKELCLDYCSNVTTGIYRNKPENVKLDTHGCWRLHSPSENMKPESVVELQIIAFQHIEEGGYDKLLQFVSEKHEYVFMNNLKENDFYSLINSMSFSINVNFMNEYDTLIYVYNKDQFSTTCFQWIMHKYNNCWMTEYIQKGLF